MAIVNQYRMNRYFLPFGLEVAERLKELEFLVELANLREVVEPEREKSDRLQNLQHLLLPVCFKY